jgi:hypothetical protein
MNTEQKQITENVLQGRIDSTREMVDYFERIPSSITPNNLALAQFLQTIATNQVVIMQLLKERI